MRAEAAGDPGPWRQQVILGRGRWGRSVTAAEPQATQSIPDPASLVLKATGDSPDSHMGHLARGLTEPPSVLKRLLAIAKPVAASAVGLPT